jgi:hypothetical protein
MSEQAEGQTQKEISGKIGKYEIVRPLGKGAMGMVYLAKGSRRALDLHRLGYSH